MVNMSVKNYKGLKVEQIKDVRFANNEERTLKEAAIEKILEVNQIDVPQELVDNEVALMVTEFNHKMKYESMASGRFIGLAQDEINDRLEEFKEEAFNLVKTRLVLKGIIEAENLEVTKEELEEEAKAISIRQHVQIEVVKDFLGEGMDLLKDDLLLRKAIDFVHANDVNR